MWQLFKSNHLFKATAGSMSCDKEFTFIKWLINFQYPDLYTLAQAQTCLVDSSFGILLNYNFHVDLNQRDFAVWHHSRNSPIFKADAVRSTH